MQVFPLQLIVDRSGQHDQRDILTWLEGICTDLELIATETAAAIPADMSPFTNLSFTGAMFAAGRCQVDAYNTTAGYCSWYDSGPCASAWPSVSPNFNITAISVNYHAEWFSLHGQQFLKHLRLAAHTRSTTGVRWYAQGRAYDEYDSASIAFDDMKKMVVAMVRPYSMRRDLRRYRPNRCYSWSVYSTGRSDHSRWSCGRWSRWC